MYIFVDTEFTDFAKCDLISLGLVSECGTHEFYCEISDHQKTWQSEFVRDIVVPLLQPEFERPRKIAGSDLSSWVNALPSDDIIFVVDYTKDWDLLLALMEEGNLVAPIQKNVEAKMLMDAFTDEVIRRGIHMLSQQRGSVQALMEVMENYYDIDPRRHHALVDAKANRAGWVAGLS